MLIFTPACPPPSFSEECSFLYDELLGGFSVWQEALSLIQDGGGLRGEERKTEGKEEGEEKLVEGGGGG